MVGSLVIYGLIVAHLNAYKEHYASIFITFSATYLMKRLIKTGGQKDHSEIIGISGYSLTIGEIAKLLGTIKKNGVKAASPESQEILGGIFGKGFDAIKDLFTK